MTDAMLARVDYARSVYADIAAVQAAVSRKAVLCMSIAGASLALFIGNIESWHRTGLAAAFAQHGWVKAGGTLALALVVAASFMAMWAIRLKARPLPWKGSAETTYNALNDPDPMRSYDEIVGWYLMAAEGLAALTEQRGAWTSRALFLLLAGLGLGALVALMSVLFS